MGVLEQREFYRTPLGVLHSLVINWLLIISYSVKAMNLSTLSDNIKFAAIKGVK